MSQRDDELKQKLEEMQARSEAVEAGAHDVKNKATQLLSDIERLREAINETGSALRQEPKRGHEWTHR